MGTSTELRIRFDLDVASGNLAADDLCETLARISSTLSPQVLRDDERRQDFGTVLGIVLSAPAVTVLARGLADWLRRQAEPVSVVVMDVDGKVIVAMGKAAENLTVAQVAEQLTRALPKG